MTTPWSDTPPSEAGWWWLKDRVLGRRECVAEFRCGYWYPVTNSWERMPGNTTDEIGAKYQFGPRVLDAKETVALTAEVERLRADIQQVRDWRDKAAKTNAGTIASLEAEIQQLRAAAAELAEIKRAWGMANSEI